MSYDELLFTPHAPRMPASVAARLAPVVPGAQWRPVATAPKSFVDAHGRVHGIYLLMWEPGSAGFGFDDADGDPQTGITVGWWEPNEHDGAGGRGCWYNGHYQFYPTFWMPLPLAPHQPAKAGGA